MDVYGIEKHKLVFFQMRTILSSDVYIYTLSVPFIQ